VTATTRGFALRAPGSTMRRAREQCASVRDATALPTSISRSVAEHHRADLDRHTEGRAGNRLQCAVAAVVAGEEPGPDADRDLGALLDLLAPPRPRRNDRGNWHRNDHGGEAT
jgi:hypothetical protein